MKRFSSYLSAALTVLLLVIGVMPAMNAAAASSGGSSGLSITPRKNYIIKPGETVTDKLTIGNLDRDADLDISLRVIDFTFSDQSGTPKLFLAANAPQTSWSLKPFTTLPKDVVVPHGGTKTVSYTIHVPKNQGAGSYYSAILYQAGGFAGGNVALNASGVTLAFVSVPGTVHENMTLQKFGAYQSDGTGTAGSFVFLATNDPQKIAYALKNSGNVTEAPAGSIVIKDMFGHTVTTISSANVNSSLALIDQTRLFTACIRTLQEQIKLEGGTTKNTSCTNPHLKPGKYTASLDVFYGQNGNQTHEVTATATFWYLPWWFIITVIVLLVAVVVGVWWLQRKIKVIVKGTTYHAGRGIRRH